MTKNRCSSCCLLFTLLTVFACSSKTEQSDLDAAAPPGDTAPTSTLTAVVSAPVEPNPVLAALTPQPAVSEVVTLPVLLAESIDTPLIDSTLPDSARLEPAPLETAEHSETTDYCTPYSQSSNYRNRKTTMIVYPESDWMAAIENAGVGTEILLEDGDYVLDKYAIYVPGGVTIRSANGDHDRVRIHGMGYDKGSEGFMILGNDIVIADISVSGMRDHAIAVKPEAGAMHSLLLYNLNLNDIGTQHIKVSPGGARDGLIACSNVGYSTGAAVGDYNGAIDLHDTVDWVIRDNFIYNITGDSTGCNVDKECGRYISAPAIYAWNGARGTSVLRNTIVDSFRNIAFGIGTSHIGGTIAYNKISQSIPGDAGIELHGASDVIVEYNKVQLSGDYPGAIEYRSTESATIANNTLSSVPWDRGGNMNIELFENSLIEN